jgi:hypothetical protein
MTIFKKSATFNIVGYLLEHKKTFSNLAFVFESTSLTDRLLPYICGTLQKWRIPRKKVSSTFVRSCNFEKFFMCVG